MLAVGEVTKRRARNSSARSVVVPPPPPPLRRGPPPPTPFQAQLHPLLIPVVLHGILPYIPPTELKTFRLVCSTWKNESLSKFRAESTVQIGPMFDYKDPNEFSRKIRATRRIWQKLKPFEQENRKRLELKKTPFRQLNIHSIAFNKKILGVGGYCTQRRINGTIFGYLSFLHKLTLWDVQIHENSLKAFQSALFENTPNLQVLELLNVREKVQHRTHVRITEPNHFDSKKISKQRKLKKFAASIWWNAVFAWDDIFVWFPNIQELTVSLDNCTQFAMVLSSLNAANMAHDDQQSCITSLRLEPIDDTKGTYDRSNSSPHIRNWTPHGVNRLLQDVYPQLPLQNLTVLKPVAVPSQLGTLLSKQKNSLKRLELILSIEDVTVVTRITMTNLEEVVLKELDLPSGSPIENFTAKFSNLFSWMQNLKKLEMDLSNKTFSSVCKNCVHLTHLSLINGYAVERTLVLDDEGITGLAKDQSLENMKAQGLERPANITDLKELKVFRVQREYVSFSDKAVYDGFLKLEHLKRLEIPDGELSATAKIELRRHLESS